MKTLETRPGRELPAWINECKELLIDDYYINQIRLALYNFSYKTCQIALVNNYDYSCFSGRKFNFRGLRFKYENRYEKERVI